MIESIKRFIAKDKVKLLMSIGDVWRQAFNDKAGEAHQGDHIEVPKDNAPL